MKSISPGMSSHLSEEVTTLCTCWKIVRQDGQVFGFTDHDMDLVFSGVTYESETGYNRTAIRSDASMSVDNLDVTGFLESDKISEYDLRNGLFDHANVYIFALNWADLTMAEIKLRRGWFGEVTLNQNGSFETEIRGLHQALSVGFMESYQPECRADFCDKRCKLNYADYIKDAFALHPLNNGESRDQFYVSTGTYTPNDPSVGAHRYWRYLVPVPRTNDFWSLQEIVFYDQAGLPIPGGTPTVSAIYSIFAPPAHARDLNPATGTSILPTDPQWFQIDFGAGNAQDVSGFSVQATSGPLRDAQSPSQFEVYYSDDGTTWTLAAQFWAGTWTDLEIKKFMGYHELPIKAIPPTTSTGATGFFSGTVKFTSGLNTGKIIEIIDWNQDTGLVTMFEGFPYKIESGDTLEIVQGCDKFFTTCQLYNNAVNFRGEPHVPGQDELLSYPDAHD
jgi:hypothetical protein